MKEYQDYAIRTWGFEDPSTIELFQMIERGEPETIIQQFIELVDGMIAEDYFGFEV